ncbi:melanopsin-A-like isoform X2 [Phyllopteryx taeniolatus]|uniref:melanopsin-A-like isoform X2 n=1 Tax=Phyllopteryx taeniolatus TaxID=161469 RepID=UPI002AD2DB07|nr:melanopsin-A-like isoform X2 [Phyllopteryx taeniolatus]
MSATRHHRTFISPNSTGSHAWATATGSGSPLDAYRRPSEPQTAAQASPTAEMAARTPHPFPTVDVPDHAHYTIGSVILAIGITGMVGNFLVIYAFSRSRSLRTPANMFIINLAVTDLLMCVTQAPVFFVSSMHKRWIFGEKACELYAFCGALFGICSMVTLTVIALDRYVVITRPLTSIGVLSRKRALVVLAAAWTYSLGWSLPPFFGWSAYVPEGLLTSCTWDYVTFTPSVRAYTMLLFVFVFFVPLLVIVCCYVSIFRAVRRTDKAVGKMSGTGVKTFHRLQNEWKMAKIALIVILLYVVSWAPYSTVALTAFAGYADMLTPYMNSVPAVIAKASAIHNPVIYAITHPKYRVALAKYIPCLGALLCVRPTDLRSAGGSFASTRRSTVTSQSSDISAHFRRHSKSRLSSVSDSESGLMDTEADLPSLSSRPASRQVSGDIGGDTAEFPEFKPSSSFKGKMKNHDSGIFERTSFDTDISTIGVSERGSAYSADAHASRGALNRIPSIVVTSESSPFLPIGRSASRSARAKATYCGTGAGSG